MNPQQDRDAVEAIVRAAGTSFHHGMRILPPDRRHAMYAVYAFCRQVDDIADDDAPLDAKHAGLDSWRARVARLYDGHADDDPVARALLVAIRAHDLRQADFQAVIDGMQSDADTVIVAPTLAELDLYCDRVAAAVGRLSVRCFGDASDDADTVAWNLGRALQLTNILRDLHEDAGRGRLYLPAEWLDDARVPPDPHAALAAPGLPRVCDRTAHAAHEFFALATEAMARCAPAAMRPARLMASTYAALLTRIERRGWTRLDERVSLSTLTKLSIAARHLPIRSRLSP